MAVPGYNINGGASGAKNGDSMFSNESKFGGLNYGTGVPPWLIAVVVIAGVFLIKK